MSQTNNTPEFDLPSVSEAALKNKARTERIIAAYVRLKQRFESLDLDEDESYEPSLEEVAAEAGVSKRDVGPVLNTYRQLEPLREKFNKVPDIFLMQILSSVNDHFNKIDAEYQAIGAQQQAVFDEGIEAHGEAVSDLEDRLATSELTVAQKQGEIIDLNDEIEELKKRLKENEESYRALDDKYKSLAVEVRELQVKRDNLAEEKDRLVLEHSEALNKAESDYKAMRQELIEQHEQANAKLMEQWGNERGDWKRDRNQFATTLASKETALKSLTEKYEDVILLNSNLSRDVALIRDEKLALETRLMNDLSAEREKVGELEARQLASSQRISELEEANKQLEASKVNDDIREQLQQMSLSLKAIEDRKEK